MRKIHLVLGEFDQKTACGRPIIERSPIDRSAAGLMEFTTNLCAFWCIPAEYKCGNCSRANTGGK